jgi:hypothetical protein
MVHSAHLRARARAEHTMHPDGKLPMSCSTFQVYQHTPDGARRADKGGNQAALTGTD